MADFVSMVKYYLNRKSSGDLEEHIQYIERSLKNIDTPLNGNYWISWYEDYLKDLLKILKINRIIPKRYYSAAKKAIDKITIDNKIIIKNILLPLPVEKSDYFLLVQGIFDSLWRYLLDDLKEDILYSSFPYYMEGAYEYKNVILKKGDIVIDAGANIGEFSALASVKGCYVYAFEPMPYIVEKYLSKTAAMNKNIFISQYALSNRKEKLFFSLKGTSTSSIEKSNDNNNNIQVEAIDLDTFAEENKLPRVDFIKADIEGAERYMLMGAKRVLKEFSPKIVICTYHLPDDSKVLKELILDANPNYVIGERWKKMYAHVPK